MKREIGKSVNRALQNNAVFRRPQHEPTTPYPSFPGTIGSGIRAAALSAHEKPARSWREIAQEASHELDPERLMELANELTRALDEQIGSARRWPRSKAVS